LEEGIEGRGRCGRLSSAARRNGFSHLNRRNGSHRTRIRCSACRRQGLRRSV